MNGKLISLDLMVDRAKGNSMLAREAFLIIVLCSLYVFRTSLASEYFKNQNLQYAIDLPASEKPPYMVLASCKK